MQGFPALYVGLIVARSLENEHARFFDLPADFYETAIFLPFYLFFEQYAVL